MEMFRETSVRLFNAKAVALPPGKLPQGLTHDEWIQVAKIAYDDSKERKKKMVREIGSSRSRKRRRAHFV